MAFDEWGKRVSYNDWTTDQSSVYAGLQVSQLFTTQGYTGHDMLDAVGLIHMQGRIYDARLGRFVQADPIVQDATDLQAYNRYAYVRNNPLTLTDPSGFSWLSKTWKKIWKNPIIKMVIIAVASYFTAGWASGWAAGLFAQGSAAAAMAGGFAGGFVAGGLTTGTLNGALIGGVSGAAFGSFGAYAKINGVGLGARSLAHGMIGGTMSVLQGGKFGHGFLSAGLTKLANISEGPLAELGDGIGGVVARTAAAAAVGGTVSELTGGKFANGAETAAYGQLFNGESKFWNDAAWTTKNFLAHYFSGGGKAVNLGAVGLGEEFKNASSVSKATEGFEKDVMGSPVNNSTRNAVAIVDVTKVGARDITPWPALFSVGNSRLEMNANCIGGACTFNYQVNDRFIDALDIHDQWRGNQDVPGAKPYDINYQWMKVRRYGD